MKKRSELSVQDVAKRTVSIQLTLFGVFLTGVVIINNFINGEKLFKSVLIIVGIYMIFIIITPIRKAIISVAIKQEEGRRSRTYALKNLSEKTEVQPINVDNNTFLSYYQNNGHMYAKYNDLGDIDIYYDYDGNGMDVLYSTINPEEFTQKYKIVQIEEN